MLDFTARLADAAAKAPNGAARARSRRGLGLTALVLAITIGFVLLAMGLFYVFRLSLFARLGCTTNWRPPRPRLRPSSRRRAFAFQTK